VTDTDGVRRFYDDLAEDYERIYADWAASSRRQAAALEALIPPGGFVLDCAAGVGTQLLGLAALGHRVVGTDLSVVALRRAAERAVERDAGIGVAAADMRRLPFPDATFDAVVCADNAVPHLLTAPDVCQALAEMRRVAVPGGVVIVTTRDYDELRRTRPDVTPVGVHRDADAVTAGFQLWTWHPDGERYDLDHLVVTGAAGRWDVRARHSTYWAIRRRELADLAAAAGLVDVRWLTPAESAFFQPLMLARRAATPR
jgi:glycine/sarcosine N-methyltransferase